MILLIVYVGAVAVLFLFVVMMLNISLEEIKNQVKKYFYSGLFVGLVLMAELFFHLDLDLMRNNHIDLNNNKNLTNTHIIGSVMYTEYFFVFQLSGCILLVAMVGAIVLTLRKREGVLRQDISKQVDRKKKDSIELIKIKNDNAN